jgi:cardiolipin synthase
LPLGADLTDQAFFRTAGAHLIPGNRVTLLRDAEENYPAWIAAIESAERSIHFESYIIHEDDAGRQFTDLLIRKAGEGVRVRVIYDWVGSFRHASRRFWRHLADGGVEVRAFNPPHVSSPFAWVSRDHRKTISVDGRISFVSGLCVGQRWVGYPERGIGPWRDSGLQIEGPAILDIERAFAGAWAATGAPLDTHELPSSVPTAGDIAVRVVASVPEAGSVYHLDHLITTLARRTIWLADAYFAGTSSYVHALRTAAQNGVDVRLLIPGTNDVPVFRAISRAGLRPLLEVGVRVFEWNGAMMHAKTAVVDGAWARVGSTNLNVTSWLGNWEMDVVVEDEGFATMMESVYLDDLTHSTEIVLRDRGRTRTTSPVAPRSDAKRAKGGAAGRTAVGIIRLSHTVGAAITRRRELGAAEAVIMLWGAALLVALAAVSILWPKVVVIPAAIFCIWIAASLVTQATQLLLKRKRRNSR